jgi:hypothetical protein
MTNKIATVKKVVSPCKNEVCSAAFYPIQAARIFHQNAKICIEAAERGINPLKRKQLNWTWTEKRPRIPTFVKEARELAQSFRRIADLMDTMSHQLEDKNGASSCDGNLMQNVQDTWRYLSPTLENLSRIQMPRNNRELDVFQNNTSKDTAGKVASAQSPPKSV